MDEYIFGANILENLTTGMYKDSKVIYREYIQNACDQIDKAIEEGLLSKGEGRIDIWPDEKNRTIVIEDNATGIKQTEFKKKLGNIADSDKEIGEDKGFRGIGRLCGLAYCKELVFSSTYKGERTISVMRCNGQKMRDLLYRSEHGEKLTASEVLNEIFDFSYTEKADKDSHWFKVELIGINDENTDLLSKESIIDYLSFTAPVPYQNTFIFRAEIYKYIKEINYSLDEYKITWDGEQIFKQYKTDFKTRKGEDTLFDIAFRDFKDDNGNLIAWMWIGLSKFKAVINKEYKMRGLRLRKENIQIGSDDALQKLFKEDRGPHYFIGEVFAVSKDLIPNSQRDYFNENPTRLVFEQLLREFFHDKLKELYYAGSEINSSLDKINKFDKELNEFDEKTKNGDFIDDSHREKEKEKLEEKRKDAEKSRETINKKRQKAVDEKDDILTSVIDRIVKDLPEKKSDNVLTDNSNKSNKNTKRSKQSRRTDKLSSYSKNERKLITRIFNVILKSTDQETAEKIIKNIEEELQ